MRPDKSKLVGQIFLNGLAVVLPAVLTIAFIWWFGTSLERVLGAALRFVLDEEYYVPGAGIAVGVVLIFLAGLATRLWLARRLIHLGAWFLEQIPIASMVFTAIRDLMRFVQSATSEQQLDKVVRVDLGNGLEAIGFVTEDADSLSGDASGDRVPVYLQMSYQMGGYTVFIDRERLTPVDVSLEDAMRWVLSAGISGQSKKKRKKDAGKGGP